MANKLLSLHLYLKDLGHPRYLKSEVTLHLECNADSKQVDGEVYVYGIHVCTIYIVGNSGGCVLLEKSTEKIFMVLIFVVHINV